MQYVVSLARAPYEQRVATLAAAAQLLGPAGQSRAVSRVLTTDSGAYAGMAPLTEADRLAFMAILNGARS